MAKKDWQDQDFVTAGALNALGAEVEAAEESDEIADLEQGKQDSILRGTVATAAATAAKTCLLENAIYVPEPGDLFLIEFTAGMSSSSSTLNINGSGALPITGASGSTSSSGLSLAAGVEALVLHDTTTYRLLTGNQTIYSAFTVAELQAGSSGSSRIVTPALLAANFLTLAAAVPSGPTVTGRVGQYALDANYLYLCVAANTWKRIPLTW